MKAVKTELTKPSVTQVKHYLALRDTLANYVSQENALRKLFTAFSDNTDLDDILLKAATLNAFYSTNIFSVYSVAKQIFSLKDVDKRLEKGDLSLVDEIRKITISGKEKDFYSFATKYCAHHNEEAFPIYDSFVDKVLWYFQQKDQFSTFKRSELKNYTRFKAILLDFRKHYQLESFTLRQLDTYLWLLGKEKFQKISENRTK